LAAGKGMPRREEGLDPNDHHRMADVVRAKGSLGEIFIDNLYDETAGAAYSTHARRRAIRFPDRLRTAQDDGASTFHIRNAQ
jgi:hypothetical protein